MRIYEGSPRQDFEEVFRSIGAFLDQRHMKDVLLLEAPDGFIVQGLVTTNAQTGSWSDTATSLGSAHGWPDLGQVSRTVQALLPADAVNTVHPATHHRSA